MLRCERHHGIEMENVVPSTSDICQGAVAVFRQEAPAAARRTQGERDLQALDAEGHTCSLPEGVTCLPGPGSLRACPLTALRPVPGIEGFALASSRQEPVTSSPLLGGELTHFPRTVTSRGVRQTLLPRILGKGEVLGERFPSPCCLLSGRPGEALVCRPSLCGGRRYAATQ